MGFTISRAAGDFANAFPLPRNLVCIESSAADNESGPGSNVGIRLCIRTASQGAAFAQETQSLKDPKDDRVPTWSQPSKCEMLDVLSQKPKIKIFGNFTGKSETLLLDGVKVSFGNVNLTYEDCDTQMSRIA